MKRHLSALTCLTLLSLASYQGFADRPTGETHTTTAIAIDDGDISLETFERELSRYVSQNRRRAATTTPLDFAETFLEKTLLAREAHRVVPEDALTPELEDAFRRAVIARYRAAKVDTVDTGPKRLDLLFHWNQDKTLTRHIVRATRAEADSVREALEAGANMRALARKVSIHERTRRTGGLWSWMRFGEYRLIDHLAWTHGVGDLVGPVETFRGWHVFRVEDRLPRETLAFLEEGLHLFNQGFPDKLRQMRWHEWYWSAIERHELMIDDAAHAAACSLLLAGVTEAPPELEARVIASDEDLSFTGSDAFTAWRVSTARRPGGQAVGYYRQWLDNELRDRMIVRDARAEGFLERRDVQAAVAVERERAKVDALYARKVTAHVQNPDRASLARHFEATPDTFLWRSSLDLSIFRSPEEADVDSIASLLIAGGLPLGAEAVARDFPEVEFRRTGPLREIPGLDALSRRVREGPETPGAILRTELIDGLWTTVRIEAVGEPTPMTFEETIEAGVLQPHYEQQQTPVRFASYVDSLRAAYHATIDTAVVRRAEVRGASDTRADAAATPTPDTDTP